MSIIEKAVEKLDRRRPGDEPAPPAEVETLDSTGEDTMVAAPAPAVCGRIESEPAPPGLDTAPPPARAPADRPGGKPGDAVRTSREVELDMDRLRAAGFITPADEGTRLAEQFRIIKRPLLMQAAAAREEQQSRANLIMVTSALPAEGKTSTALNLALSVAMERDRTVLFIDGDTAKADGSRLLGVADNDGLSDYLLAPERPLADVLVRTSVPKLVVLPSGKRHPNMTELLASEEMSRLTAELSGRYRDRIIIIDSPPLLASATAKVLASLAGQIIMVVEAIRTPQSALKHALDILGPLDRVALVLNKNRDSLIGRGYSYGYSYGYGYGYGNRKTAPR